MWVVDVGIPYTDEGLWDAFEVGKVIEDEVGYASSAGSGFGYRDMQFEVDSNKEAVDLVHYIEHVLDERDIEIDNTTTNTHKAYVSAYQERKLP